MVVSDFITKFAPSKTIVIHFRTKCFMKPEEIKNTKLDQELSDEELDLATGGKHNLIDSNDTIDVLKDAASAAIYGAKGANGVILITE